MIKAGVTTPTVNEGPLKRGDFGVLSEYRLSEQGKRQCKVLSRCGCAAGKMWWYFEDEIVPFTPTAIMTDIPLKSQVTLSKSSQQRDGPLEDGDVGEVESYDIHAKDYQVRAVTGAKTGQVWFYKQESLIVIP